MALRSLGQWFGPAARANPTIGSSGCRCRVRRVRRTDVRLQAKTAALWEINFPRVTVSPCCREPRSLPAVSTGIRTLLSSAAIRLGKWMPRERTFASPATICVERNPSDRSAGRSLRRAANKVSGPPPPPGCGPRGLLDRKTRTLSLSSLLHAPPIARFPKFLWPRERNRLRVTPCGRRRCR